MMTTIKNEEEINAEILNWRSSRIVNLCDSVDYTFRKGGKTIKKNI